MSNELKYVEASKIEAHGLKSIGVKIMVAIGRELTEEDGRIIHDKCEELMEAINLETDRNDPDLKKEIIEERKKMIGLFDQPIHVKEIPNEYGENVLFPWFEVTTKLGVIKIGWRRRVINIDWSNSDIEETAEDLFPDENVTKEGRSIHAWSYEKAKEYISYMIGAHNGPVS